MSGKGMGDSIGVLLKPSELSGSANALESHHRAVGAHARPKGNGLCSLRFLLAGSQGFGNSGEPPAVRPKVDRPEEPTDWTHDTLTTSSINLILYLCKFLVHIYNPDVHVITCGLNIIINPSLGDVFAKGPNFHEPKSINWTHNFEIVLNSSRTMG